MAILPKQDSRRAVVGLHSSGELSLWLGMTKADDVLSVSVTQGPGGVPARVTVELLADLQPFVDVGVPE